jgi:hypothetical protein
MPQLTQGRPLVGTRRMEWRPLSVRGNREAEEAYALHDGIPEWLKPSVWDWIAQVLKALCEPPSGSHPAAYVAYESWEDHYRRLLRMLQTELQLPLRWLSLEGAKNDLLERSIKDPQVGLNVLDWLLHFMHPHGARHADELESILHRGRSKWCVSAGRDSLEERVAREVAERAAQLTTSGTRPGRHLREAWHSVYGRNPNPSFAHSQAVKAVEAAAIPLACPNDATATLGKIIGIMKATGDRWKLALQPTTGDAVNHVVSMMQLLWKSQYDRHGTPDPSAPLSVGREEAEAAVHLALTLTHWFESGAVSR